ncbi:Broad substrate specificity ATP-binding cassette transporter ABCG2 [Taenia crassiceps]|uniref:Broad substrate specificity ATP-binding cassette transporter ABCG2 n=1 Tax=Taenia crassiceps TaxID=6207 RepID=A0ABR4QS73_9CEST
MASMKIEQYISFHDVSYSVRNYKFYFYPHGHAKLLHNLTGIMKPGINVIIGPTGCGKTTFLDVLAGRSDPSLMSGVVLINGKDRPSNFKRTSAYVSQNNFAVGSLTVRENLYFSAALRLPAWVSRKERKSRVSALLIKLGLNSVADVKVGTEMTRGISGGERKRTNIGIELITDPSVIFLDEPTTGLDTHTASKLMKLLKRLTIDGKTIIASIHQPNSSIYKLFDSLTLLCNGRAIYHGPVADDAPLNYFGGLGYKVSSRENPADFFIDLLHEDLPSKARDRLPLAEGGGEPVLEESLTAIDDPKPMSISLARSQQLQRIFEASAEWSSWINEAKAIFSMWRSLHKPPKQMSRECSSSHFHSISGSEAELSPLMINASKLKTVEREVAQPFDQEIQNMPGFYSAVFEDMFVTCTKDQQPSNMSAERREYDVENWGKKWYKPVPLYQQFGVLACRGFLDTLRNPNGAAVPFIGVAIFTLILGTVYYQLDFSSEAGIQNRTGLFYFVCLELAYFNGNAVDIFIRDQARFKHERACGFYCTSMYFLAKVVCEVLPIKLGPILFFFPILYAMTGLRRSFTAMLFWEAACLCMGAASTALVIFCILLFNHVALGYAVSGILLSFMMTFGGFLLNVVSAWWLGWCRYFSIFWYALSAMSINEMQELQFCPKVTTSSPPPHEAFTSPFASDNLTKSPSCVSGNEFLRSRGMSFDSSWQVWSNLLALFVIAFVAFFLCYFRLRFTKTY